MAEPSIAAQVVALTKLSVPELREKWRELFGDEPGQRRRVDLIQRIAWEVQRRAGDIEQPQVGFPPAPVAETAREATPSGTFASAIERSRPRTSSRAPAVGTTLLRSYKGRKIAVKVVDGGFRYGDRTFTSLSAVAKHIVGYNVSGPLFFRSAEQTPPKRPRRSSR